jgi:cyclase
MSSQHHQTRPRLIASLLLINNLAHISYEYTNYEYVGDPINIINLLSGFNVDEVLIIDLSASQSGNLSLSLLSRLRALADFPLSYAGGIRSFNQACQVMNIGFDKLLFSISNPLISDLCPRLASRYGNQSLALSIDYISLDIQRYVYNPYSRRKTSITIDEILSRNNLAYVSDLLLSSVDRAGRQCGVDHTVLQEPYIACIDNPIVLAGGLLNLQSLTVCSLLKTHPSFAGIAASSSIFLQSGPSSSLVCLERHLR